MIHPDTLSAIGSKPFCPKLKVNGKNAEQDKPAKANTRIPAMGEEVLVTAKSETTIKTGKILYTQDGDTQTDKIEIKSLPALTITQNAAKAYPASSTETPFSLFKKIMAQLAKIVSQNPYKKTISMNKRTLAGKKALGLIDGSPVAGAGRSSFKGKIKAPAKRIIKPTMTNSGSSHQPNCLTRTVTKNGARAVPVPKRVCNTVKAEAEFLGKKFVE